VLLVVIDRTIMPDRTLEGRQSAIDMMILKALSVEDMHGWGISQYIQRVSRDVLQINQGSLYPALHRLERDGCIRAEWRPSENNRRAKYYELSATGRRQLDAEHRDWVAFSQAVQRVMQS
jgi:transcriptional regulator